MAYLRGGSTKNVVLVGKLYDNATFEGKEKDDGTRTKGGQFVDFEIARFVDANGKKVNENQPPQFNPSLRNTKSITRENTFDRGVAYNEDELASFLAAAGPNIETISNHKTGQQVGKLIVLQADVLPSKTGEGQSYLRVNHKSAVSISDIALPENIREAQYTGVQNDIASLQAEKKAKDDASKAPEAEAVAEVEKDAVPNF
ncbi:MULTISPECIES: hypothetical protein [Gordonia]|uniref:hypothetical protein n=1 Tax=Gordonia TaxID=2053 RepID=UPI0001DD916C|nr:MULTISPECIES: hypothetical protein [Gordonia]ADK68935.1 hypothetical protein KTR9_4854 [Gordonia sp. KTR9]MCZ4580442.1 hypothetical protein [Gordonia amicalis]